MDFPALIAALPAATIAAVATTPKGLTAASQVLVVARDEQSANTARAVWWLPPVYEPLGTVLGGELGAWTFDLSLVLNEGDDASLEVWAEQLRAYFAGAAKPAGITGLLATSVRDILLRTSENGTDLEMAMRISFVGIHRPA